MASCPKQALPECQAWTPVPPASGEQLSISVALVACYFVVVVVYLFLGLFVCFLLEATQYSENL